jgi:PAS domain S-box-containing protein
LNARDEDRWMTASSNPKAVASNPTRLPFLDGGGEAARVIAAFDWSMTPLGALPDWPRSVKHTVALLLRSPVPMVLLWGPDGLMIYNDGYARIAGGRHPSAMGSKCRESWPEIADFNDHVLRTCLAGGTLSFTDQHLTLHRDGRPEETWLNLDYSPVLDDDDRPGGVIAIVAETTAKVRAENWQTSDRERLRQMFEQAPSFMAILNGPEHEFVLVNPAYQELIGNRDVVGKTVRQAFPDLEAQGFYELLDAVFASGKAFAGTTTPIKFHDAATGASVQRYLDFVYQPLRDRDGRVIGIFVDGSDVTDRVLAEQARRADEIINRQVLDSALDYAIIAVDLEGKVTRWNEGARRIMGWTESEMLGGDLSRIFTPADRAAGRPAREFENALAKGRASDERWHLRRSGEQFWASGEMTPIRDQTGAPVGFVKVLRDRTEQHRAGEALRQSELRLRRAQEAGGVGVFSLDLATRVVSGSAMFFRLYGLGEVESANEADIAALVLSEDWKEISTKRNFTLEAAPLDIEYRIRRADDGSLRWISRKAEFERDASGRPLRLVGVVQDVTEQRLARRDAEQNAAQFFALAQTLPALVWTAQPDGTADWFNDRVYEYSGRQPGDILFAGWHELLHADDLEPTVQRWLASMASGDIYNVEYRLRRGDGVYRWHIGRALPVRGDDGRILRWIGTAADIHEQKLAQAESSRDRDRIWALSQEIMLICDGGGVIRAANPSTTRLLGWTAEEMVGRMLPEFVHRDDLALAAMQIAKLAHGPTTLAFESRVRTKDGRVLLIACSAEPAGDDFYVVGRDVTEQRAAEEALRQAQKMEAVGQLTGGIAHDFNNLLQGITGSLNLIQKRIAQGRLAELDRYISGAMASAGRAAALTHRLLAFSRRQPLNPRAVRANPLVSSMEDLLRRTLGERIDFKLELAADPWPTMCDPNQLENAILNLVINARDAMPDGGRLTIETRNASIDSTRHQGQSAGDYVCISVADTGTGMSADTIGKAFEPFFTTKPIGQGTGLGLSMIYGFVRQSGGFVDIDSELGVGTTVLLYLPRFRGTPDEEESGEQALPEHGARRNETVLVVEDEPVVRALIVEVLRELGYRALEADDGPAGLAMLESNQRIDLLVTDIGLPGLNGRQIVEAGRQLRPSLRVLFMTGYAETAAMAPGFLEPGMTMITKPFAMDALALRIRECLE